MAPPPMKAWRAGLAPLLLLAALAWPCRATSLCTEERLSRFASGWPQKLDTSLYWFNQYDLPKKAVDGKTSEFYDPSRRTVIFFHGWTGSDGGTTRTCHRMTTRCPDGTCHGRDDNQLLMDSWFDAGWNVGLFYWDQFADEECVRDAEQKIWFDGKGDGLTWKSYDRKTGVMKSKNHPGGAMSVADLCVSAFWTALGAYSGPEVRFVGHSIGAQLAVRCASMLHHQGHPAAPQRLALLEPYFTKHHLWLFRCVGKTDMSASDGVGNFAPLATSDTAKHLYEANNVLTEVYKTSVYTEMSSLGNTNTDLEQFATFVQYEPRWCGGMGPLETMGLRHVGCRHYAVIPLYFLGFGQSPPTLMAPLRPVSMDPTSALATCPTPSASCKYGELRQWIERQLNLAGQSQKQKWTQRSGFETLSVLDDHFELTPREDPANELVEAAVLQPRWTQMGGKGRAVALRYGLIAAPCILMALFVCVVVKLVHSYRHTTQEEQESDCEGDPSVTERLMKARQVATVHP